MAVISHKSLVDIYEYRYDYHSARLVLKDTLEAAGLEAQISYNQTDLKITRKDLGRFKRARFSHYSRAFL
jgi:hypothetical protein